MKLSDSISTATFVRGASRASGTSPRMENAMTHTPRPTFQDRAEKAEWKSPKVTKLGKYLVDVRSFPVESFTDGLGAGGFIDTGLS